MEKNDSFKSYVSEMTEIFKYLKKKKPVHVEINIKFNFTKILWFC